MKTYKLPAGQSHLQIDRWAAQQKLRVIRVIPGREAKNRRGAVKKPERQHVIVAVSL